MLFITKTLATIGSSFYAGSKLMEILQQRQPEPTVDAKEQDGKRFQNHASSPDKFQWAQPLVNRLASSSPKEAFTYVESHWPLRPNRFRSPLIEKITAAGEEKQVDGGAEKEIEHKLTIFSGTFAVAAAGYMINPALGILSLPGVLYVLKDIYRSSYRALADERRLNVDALASVLVTLMLFNGYFFACNVHALIYLINRKMLAKTRRESKHQMLDIFQNQDQVVWRLSNGVEVETPLAELKLGDWVVVSAGETIPVDGRVVDGVATIDQHILTGEAQPVEKGPDAQAFALTLVLAGKLVIEVEQAGEDTVAAQIAKILTNAVDSQTEKEMWSERLTDRTVIPTFCLAGLIAPLLGPESAMVVLNSHFRYRLNLITSTGVLAFLNIAAKKGLLIKDGRILEMLSKIDTVVFDKTGTLTQEQPHVAKIYSSAGFDEEWLLQVAAAAEHKQPHPIAKAILQEADDRQLVLPLPDEAEYRVGYGVTVTIDGQQIHVGSARLMEAAGFSLSQELIEAQQECRDNGHSLVFVAIGDVVAGAIELHATVRPEVPAMITGLYERGIQSIYIISGDQEAATQRLAEELQIDGYFAETLPENKADLITQLQGEGKTVCYVGDGINDAIALQQADISISLSGASSIATDTAQIILMDKGLYQVCALFDLAQEFDTTSKAIFTSILTPSLLNISGALFLDFSMLESMMLTGTSVFAGFANAVSPLLKEKRASIERADALDDNMEKLQIPSTSVHK